MFEIFIKRPVVSIVISLIIVFLGLLSLFQLPMTQFPNVAPPEVNVSVEYTGANAETVSKAALVPLERAINGVPGMKYMSSDAGNDGVGVVQVIFEIGTDPDVAAVNVQNRVAAVMGELPQEVIKNGVKIAKEENAMLMYLNIYSTDTSLSEKFLYNYADIHVLSELKRVKGVGYADILGAKEYAMRIWLKPDKLQAYNLSTDEVKEAIIQQNIEAAPGKLGENSDKLTNYPMQFVLKYSGKFNKENEYGMIPIKSTVDGKILRLRDVAEIEFGTSYFDVEAKLNGKPCASILLKQLPGSNASEVIKNVKSKMMELKENTFIKGMDYSIGYDVSRFLDASVHEVIKTLLEAFLLVSLVVFIFLQDWKSTIIPALTVPVALIGTFFFMQLFGFSLNLITLFALVLAIGIVIDDAIVVVEAIHVKLDQGLNPKDAAIAAINEISGAIIGITLVMSAVFIPTAFMSGPVGIFFRQFSITMSISIAISGLVALTLTPALCSVLLHSSHDSSLRNGFIASFFKAFNQQYDRLSQRYKSVISKLLGRRVIIFGSLLLVVFFTIGLERMLPKGFIPQEDQGMFYVSVTTPPGSTLERTKLVVNQIQKVANQLDGVESVSSLSGTNILSDGTGATYGTLLINLKKWDERNATLEAIMKALEVRTKQIKTAKIEMFPPPAVPGYGNASGFELRLLNKTGEGDWKKMERVVNNFIADLKKCPEIGSAFSIFDASFPQYLLKFDYDKAAQHGVKVGDALESLQTLLGSEYTSNFIRFGQMYKVMLQSLPQFRSNPEDILRLTVKNERDELVPFSNFVSIQKVYGVDQLTRYNMFPSAELNGEAATGYSSGEVIKAIQKVAEEKLPNGYAIDWAGITRDEVGAGNQTIFIFLICIVFVYLLLSAQYNSFLLPLPVMVSLPIGIFGAYSFLWLCGLENNIYAQVAMVMLIGLLGKNAILIVEYANQRKEHGLKLNDAVIEAANLRLRPILMTSFAFIVGLLPLAFSSGAGEVGNRTIGTASIGGMLIGTVFGLLIIPGLFVFFFRFSRNSK